MTVLGHDAVRWDGKKILGGAPAWIVVALRKAPMMEGAIVRVHDTVHVFAPNPLRDTTPRHMEPEAIVQIAQPGDWILYERKNGSLLVQTHGQMLTGWEWRDGGYYRREGEIVVRANTEQDLLEGTKILAGWTVVTAKSHPRLHAAFEKISHDRGSGAGHETYSVPPEWSAELTSVNSVLLLLCDEDLEMFCIGEQGDQQRMVDGMPGLATAHKMLNAFFEDWNQ